MAKSPPTPKFQMMRYSVITSKTMLCVWINWSKYNHDMKNSSIIETTSSLQNAMTSSEERPSAEAAGYRIERALMDCVAPLRKGGDAIHQCPRADSWLLRRIFTGQP